MGLLHALTQLLMAWGAEVIAAPIGNPVIERLGDNIPDVVIADCEIDDEEDGFTVLIGSIRCSDGDRRRCF